jgi:hypothetical protein
MFPYKSLPFPENVDKGLRTEGLVSWSVGQFFSRLYWGLYVEVRICKEFYFYQRINPADILEIINENLIFALS